MNAHRYTYSSTILGYTKSQNYCFPIFKELGNDSLYSGNDYINPTKAQYRATEPLYRASNTGNNDAWGNIAQDRCLYSPKIYRHSTVIPRVCMSVPRLCTVVLRLCTVVLRLCTVFLRLCIVVPRLCVVIPLLCIVFARLCIVIPQLCTGVPQLFTVLYIVPLQSFHGFVQLFHECKQSFHCSARIR